MMVFPICNYNLMLQTMAGNQASDEAKGISNVMSFPPTKYGLFLRHSYHNNECPDVDPMVFFSLGEIPKNLNAIMVYSN